MAKQPGVFTNGSGVWMYGRDETEETGHNRSTGTRDIHVWNFYTGRDDDRSVIAASPEYISILAPFIMDGAHFYYDDINVVRVDPNAGATPNGDPLSKWKITVTFQSVTGSAVAREDNTIKPSQKPPRITWTSRSTQLAATADAYGRPYANTAADYFDGISRLADEVVYKFSVNIALPVPAVDQGLPRSRAAIDADVEFLNANQGYEPWWAHALGNTVNAHPVQIRGTSWPRNTLRAGGFSAGNVAVENGEVFFPLSWEMVGHKWNWTREVANVGTNSLHFTILQGAFDGVYTNPNDLSTFVPGNSPATEFEIDGQDLFQEIMAYNTANGGPTDPAVVADMTQLFLLTKNRVRITKKPIRGASDPVFLDYYGQHDPTAIPPGIISLGLGGGTAGANSRICSTDFNIYDFLGARLDTGTGTVIYVPNSPDDLVAAQIGAGVPVPDAHAQRAAGVSFKLPLVIGALFGGPAYTSFRKTTTLSFRAAPGITLTFQDYVFQDHTVLPGVYPSTTL